MRSLRSLLLAVALLAAALTVPSSAGALVIGIGDQKPDMFSSPLFASLGITHARIAVSWDAMDTGWQRAEVDTWMNAAHAAGVQPLVGFGHARGDRRRVLPSPSRFKYEFRLFRKRYPWVTTYATWNEANHCGEPTCHRPELVAAYYRAMKQECPGCTILAAEMLDEPDMAGWVKAFQKHLGYRPKYWGLHNYLDANRLRTSGTKTLLRITSGQIWFTETGGIVSRDNAAKITFPESASHAATATRWVFNKLVPLSPRITRVYLYQWNAVRGDNWDSGLLDPHGKPRPAMKVVSTILKKAAARKRARAEAVARQQSASG
ncbi:MAG TPA: hypothetical protein VGM33_19750 [Baekduia sp.]